MGGGRGGVPDDEDRATDLSSGRRVLVPPRRADESEGVRRPKYTVSPVYEGLLKEEMDAAAERHPEVPYEPQLIDATFALLIGAAGDPLVIPALNRDGDILSDLVLPLFGSIAGSESLLVAFREDYTRARSWPRRRTARRRLMGKNVANPMAMISPPPRSSVTWKARRPHGRSRYQRGLARSGLGGDAHRRPRRARLHPEFTDEVINRVRSKLDVWATLGEG